MLYQSLEEETDMKLLEERIQKDGIVREGINDFLYLILFRNCIDLACFNDCRFASDAKKSGTTFRNHFNFQLTKSRILSS